MDLRLGAAPADGTERDDGAHHLCWTWERYASLRDAGAGARASAWDDHVPDLPRERVLSDTESLAEDWRFHRGTDFTVFRGISLGRCWRWLVWKRLMPAYRFALSFPAAVARFAPARVSCEAGIPAAHRALLREIARGAPWELRMEADTAEERGGSSWLPPGLAQSLPKRAAAAAVNAAARLAFAPRRPPLLISYYRPLHGAVARLARRDAPARVLCVDAPSRDLLPRLVASGGGLLRETRTPAALSSAERAELDGIWSAWEAARADPEWRARLSRRGVSFLPVLEPAVSSLLGAPAEQLAWAALRARELWKRDRPAAMLLPYEEPPYQMLLAELAREHGTPCAHFVHGLPDRHRVPFVRNSSSHLVFWGPEQRRRYEASGCLEGRQALETGNPGFDALCHSRPAPPSRVRRVLALTATPSPAVWTESDLDSWRYLERLSEVLSGFPGLDVSLRPHPSERAAGFRDIPAIREGRLALAGPGSFEEQARVADLVIGPFSTALIEAMLLNRPVLLLRWTRTPYDAPFDGEWGVEPLRTPEALRERLERLIRSPELEIPALLAAYPRIFEAFLGPLDGRASERLAAALERLAAQRQPA